MQTTELRIEKRIPPSLKNTIYESMAKAIAEEMYEYRRDVKKQKQSLWDASEMDKERLIQISKTFDVPFTASLDNTEEFARQEILAIPFKIKFKGTATLYKSFFLAANRIGQIFIYYFQSASNALIRYAKDPIADLPIIPPGETFIYYSSNDFSGFVEEEQHLDTGLRLDVGDPLWTLDTKDSQITSNHIGLEYVIDRIITKIVNGKEKEYLMTAEYLNFISVNMEYGRRAKEVPHVGSQLNIQTDLSGTFDSFSPGEPYTIPSVKVKAATRKNALSLIESVEDLLYMEFGTGRQPLPSAAPGDATPFPTALAQRVSLTETIYRERFENVKAIGVVGEYLGQQINKYTVHTAGGSENEFRFTLPYKPIRRGNVRFIITHPSIIQPKIVTDDQTGNLTGDYGKGTINYNTGEVFLTTKFDNKMTEKPAVPPKYDDEVEKDKKIYDVQLKSRNIYPGSMLLSFHVGDGDDEHIALVRDNGVGAFLGHPNIVNSSIDYQDGWLVVEFDRPLTPNSAFEVSLAYPVDYILPEGAEIIADYYFTQATIEITEAGLFSLKGDLISYATFPPFEFSATDNHLNVLFAFRKDILFNKEPALNPGAKPILSEVENVSIDG